VKGIENRRAKVYAPTFPWAPLSVVMRVLPLPLASKLTPPRGIIRPLAYRQGPLQPGRRVTIWPVPPRISEPLSLTAH